MTENWLLARPEVDLEAVRALALREYGVDGALTELGSQQDRNFLVRAGDGTGMLVKIFHPSTDADAVALHIAASDRLRACGLLTPEVLTTAGGARTTSIGCDDGQTALLAGFQIVDGQPLAPMFGDDLMRGGDPHNIILAQRRRADHLDHPVGGERGEKLA